MLVTFIFGVAAGWLSPRAEERIRLTLNDLLPDGMILEAAEMPRLSLALCLVLASIFGAILGTGNAILLALGAVVGVAAPRALELWRSAKAPDYDS